MKKYFKSIKSFDDLKKQYKDLLKVNHPDNGGDLELMKEINVEYDLLFPVWKNRKEQETGQTINETADSTRSQFYTENGWEGSRHNWKRSLKEIAQIVRAYVKEKYPTYKFSVRTSYASMCKELHVAIKESPINIYKEDPAELTEQESHDLFKKLYRNDIFTKDTWYPEELNKAIKETWETKGTFYKVLNDVTKEIVKDIDGFVQSYNYNDCDGRIDYFHVDFYYFGCKTEDVKIVPKTARIKSKSGKVAKTKETSENPKNTETQNNPEVVQNNPEIADLEVYPCLYTYEIKQDIDTRDNSVVWIVKIKESLTRDQYLEEKKAMKIRGGYYSKFKKGFLFRFDPTEILSKKVAA